MASDERLKWLEQRIGSSMRPRNEDLKNMMANDENRLAFYEFVNNEDVKRLLVYMRPGRQIVATLQPPMELQSKSIYFLKCNPGTKLTKDNMDFEVYYSDSSQVPLQHLELTIREVFLPLLSTNNLSLASASGTGDKVMDILHRLMAAVEVTQGHVEGRIVLTLPSIEVLAEAAASPSRRAAVLHVLETTVIGWIKQIRAVLRHDPQEALAAQFGPEPGPLDEIAMWETHLASLQSINDQLDSDVARDILQNLETANSQYAQSFGGVRRDIGKAEAETSRILKFLNTMEPWYQKLHASTDSRTIINLFKPLMHVLNLVWSYSTYYHQIDKFHHLLRLLSNEVVHRAIAMVGDDILREPLESYSKLKEALRVCAAFRGTYLDFKDKADDQNAKNIAENAEKLAARPQGNLFTTKMYGPHAYAPRYGLRHLDGGSSSDSVDEDELWMDSPWPARNAPCFDLLNSFMERCNDVLELVETTRHFRLLAGAAEVGGAGSASLDAMVKELHTKYTLAMRDFFSQVTNVLSIDGTQMFERAFFNFRTTVKALEKRLSGILRLAFDQCGIVQSQLRLLEVFEGVSGRELVQAHLKDVDKLLVHNFNAELQECRSIFKQWYLAPPLHHNMPPIVSKLMWVYGLKERIRVPMEKMKQVSPHSLEGDQGYEMRDSYTEIMAELDTFESNIVARWQTDVVSELTSKLKQPLLIAEEYDDEIDVRPQMIHVNLDPQLLLVLKEIHYLSRSPFNIKLPEPAKELLRNTNSQDLNVTATRLETIVSKYNTIMRTVTAFERPMFERKLLQIDNLLEKGLQQYTWKMKESADFIESAMSLVCLDVHQNLDTVQTNCHEVAELTMSWSQGTLDVFQARDKTQSYSMDQLMALHKQLNDELEAIVNPAGLRIHALVKESYEVVQISAASPAWRDYIDYMDAIVLDGLKQTSLSSLKGMLNTLVQANMVEDPADSLVVPILTIRLELIENNVGFRPPLDQSTSVVSVQELVHAWLQSYLARGKMVSMLGPKGSYEDYIAADEEVKQLLADINQVVSDNGEDCKKLLEVFKEYAFLWQQDVAQTFEDFLQGYITPNPLRSRSATQRTAQQDQAAAGGLLARSDRSSQASRASSAKSTISAEVLEHAERTFLTPKAMQEGEKSNVPSLDEFDQEIDTYRTARDEIMNLEEYHNVGWIRVDLQPIKQVLTTYASKWMWTFTKYLSDQVTSMLEKLDQFLKRIEPEIESITGEERDTASFMKMMRLFNEVSAQQSEMDGKFAAMHKTVLLLKKYGQILPEKTQFLFNAAPGRWNNLKTKVSLAKQRLGPRIQEESASITVDLEAFSVRVQSLSDDLDNSDVYQRECSIPEAHNIVDNFSKRLLVLENEAQDLIELQELLEASVVNFSVLPTCRHELNNLKQVWETVRVIEEQQSEWKRHRWQKMNTKFLREETNKQLDIVRALPEDVFTWDVYMGLHESITTIQACLPLIDDLSNPAMRTRHWKQLVRVTGGALTIDNDTLKRMTLKELLSLGLQQHVDDVRAIVQRAVKDLAIENALKTYEEVWLSKVFELRYHVRNKLGTSADITQDNQSEYSQSEAAGPVSTTAASRNARTVSRVSNQSSHSKNKRSSISSLPASLLNLGEDSGTLMLLTHTDPIFEELEHHQITLQAMQSNSAAGSFLDEVLKWQKRLQNIEAVLTCWLEVQDKWVEMEEVYTSVDVKQALSHDANRFSTANKDFRLLMRATEKNPNVLQCCSRKNILKILEHMNRSLETCRKALLLHLERRRQIFPRFFFLSMEDVLHIVCTGYDLNMVNLYISKVLQNVNHVVWEEVDDNERYSFIITAIQSALGERLQLDQAVCCEGQIETWLSTLVSQIKSSLQAQLSHALGHGYPTRPKHPHRDSPRKPNAQPAQDAQAPGSAKEDPPQEENKEKSEDGAAEPPAEETAKPAPPPEPVQQAQPGQEETGSVHQPLPADGEDGKMGSSKSWTLDHVTEVVHLATRVQTSEQLKQALENFDNGEKDALKECLTKLDSSIQATVLLLKGIEGEKEEIILKAKKDKQDTTAHDISGELESEVDLPRSPFRKPTMDSEVARTPGHDDVDGESKDGTVTTVPVDTMNLAIDPTNDGPGGSLAASGTGGLGTARDEAGAAAERDDGTADGMIAPEVKLMLFPSQVHKLTSLLSLLAHLRDLVQRLMDISEQNLPTESFDWKSQLRYEFEPSTCATTVTCLNAQFDYGFEYLGSTTREVISPLTERVFVMITQAVKAHVGILAMGPREGTKFEVINEMSKCLGQPLYVFNCGRTTDYIQLQDIFRGLASTGSWVCFNDMSMLQPSCLSLLAQLMASVNDALRAGKGAVHLQTDDVQLSPHGACFGLMSASVPVKPHDSDRLLIYPSASAQLPDSVLNQFRVVSLAKPDLLLSLQVLLFSQGFLYGRELAWKTNQLYETCQNMFGTNTFVTNNVTLGASRSASFYGWSIQSLKGVVEEAGAMLEKAQTEDKETGLSTIQEFGEMSTDGSGTLIQAAKKLQQEEEALVTALRDTFLPRMTSRDASVFATIVCDLWPNVEVSMVFGAEEEDPGDRLVPGVQKYNSQHSLIKSDTRIKSSKSQESQRSIKDSLKLNTPVVPMLHAGHEKFSALLDTSAKQVLEDINDAIAVATADLGLLPGTAFQARVMQLSQLNAAHQAILVVGPPGCGKSECIKTFAVAERERGKYINVQSIFTKAVETGELFGNYDPNTREWHDGLLTALLRKFCVTPPSSMDSDKKDMMKIMQLDGECDSYQMELLQSILNNSGSVVMANNERLSIPDNLRVVWELESLEHMSPSVLATVGVLVMSSADVGWKLMLVQWLEHRNEPDKDLLTEFCNIYLESIVDYVTRCTQSSINATNNKKKVYRDGTVVAPPLIGGGSGAPTAAANESPQYKRVISHSLVNMIRTFTNLIEVLVNPFNDLSDVEYERYFNYAAIWAFGGTLAYENRESFSNWWRQTFEEHIDYPPEDTVFDYMVDNESHEFCHWKELVPSYTGTPHQGIPPDAFVHTMENEQLLHLLGLLTDAGKPVMLVGENGCGKTAIINERIRTVCSGEVAEVLSLTLYANRFTNARLLFDRIDERLEWKHGRTFVPKGNKRLLCLVDDVNLSQTDTFGHQTACELIREHLDDGGFYSPSNHMWRYVKSVTYVTSVNPQTTAQVPPLSQRLLRHFAVFGCPYPGADELKTIYSTLLNTHFFTPDNASSSSSGAGHFGLGDDRSSHGGNVRFLEEALKATMTSMVKVTVELSERMRSMFLPTSQRCHYFFTTRDLSTIFRNLCLSLRPGCNKRDLLLLWQHEAFWVYGKRMVNEVDFRRFRQAFVTAVRKQFIDDDQIQTIIRPRSPLFSNLMEQDSGIVTAGLVGTRINGTLSDEDAKTDLYRPAKSFAAVKELLEKGVEEYNKIHPRIKLPLYKTVIEQVCRLARTIASPHEDANSVLVAEGCPARCSVIVRLAANLCGYTIHQVTSTNTALTVQAKMDQFKADLVSGYTRAGAKGEHILLLLREEELADKDYLVYLTEFILSGAITHLFTHEEQTTIINSIRTEVTQAGLTYTRDVAWNFFLRTVRNNFRVMLVMCGGADQFHVMCRDYPSLAKNVNFIWFPHWSKTQLIEHALFHIKEDMSWLTEMQQENVSHMLASMHLVLRQQDGGEQTCGEYGHLNNASYQKFVERFISLANAKNSEVNKTHETVTKTLQQIRHENEVAIKLKKQLEHEMVVLQERRAGTIKILSQIGQDTAITEQQIRVVKNQLEKITHLKKRLPEYQVAHERAVYKAIAIVADTKKVVKLMDVDDLAELRGMQKPSLEIEDLMAAIIMLLKSPSADLTWQKGAKRQMANLERFIEELTTFDDFQLPESTLVLVEPFLKKPSFEPQAMAEKTGNTACGALCKWVRGVVRYHRMMISKVKPLHQKVEETTLAVDSAQHKMNTLENKRKALEIRLADLARGFEEATIDKNDQEEKTIKMKKMLDTAAQLRRILRGERQRCQQIFDSFERRLVAIPGGCAMAAAFASYLGAYHHNFRRVMLTVHWPGCLRERGIPLVIDSVDGLRGRVIDWSIAFLKTASGASSVYEVDYATLVQNMGSSSKHGSPRKGEDIHDKADDEEKEKDEAELQNVTEEEGEEDETGEGDETGETGDASGGNVTKETVTREDADETGEEEKADAEKSEDASKSQAEADKSMRSKTPSQTGAGSEGKPKTPEGSTGAKPKTPEGANKPKTPEGSAKPKTPDGQQEKPKTPEGSNKAKTPPKTPEGSTKAKTPRSQPDEEPELAAVDQASSGDGDAGGLTIPRLSKIQEEDGDLDDDMRSEVTTSTAPVLTSSQYNKYVRSLIKLLVGEPRLNEWIMQDFGPRQIENVAILCTSWQRPPLMVDPNGEGALWLARLNSVINKRKLISLDMENRSDPHIMSSLEKAITKGKPVLMKNIGEKIDNMIEPLVHHRNTAHENDREEEPRMILFCGRRTLCHPDFRFYLASMEQKPSLNAITASSVTLINFGVSQDTLTEDLLTRLFARVRPDLFRERCLALKNLQRQKDTLYRFSETVKDQVLAGGQEAMLSSPKALQFITNITDAKLQLAHQLAETQAILEDLDILKDELYPVARRGSLLYSLMRSLAAVYPELTFTMDYFLHLFDEAVGGSFPEEFLNPTGEEGIESDDSTDEIDGRARAGSPGSQQGQNGNGKEGEDNDGKAAERAEEGEKPAEEAGGAAGEGEEEDKKTAGPAETEESVSTGAVQKLVHGSDSDELPPIEMPEVVPLPSEGLEYTSLTASKVKIHMDALTSLVYHRVKMCLFEEDRLLFSTLMCLNMKVEAGEDITNEEMSLFLQGNPGLGMQLSLQDFECRDAEVPDWLPTEQWEDVLALSVLPGPLDSLCVQVAGNSEAWREWYTSANPEKKALPSKNQAETQRSNKDEKDEGMEKADEGTEKEDKEGGRGSAGPMKSPEQPIDGLNDFHRLLLLRMLRPDRLPSALLTYTRQHLALHDPEEEVFNVTEVLKEARKHLGVLILLPPPTSDPRGHPAMRLKLTKSPVEELIVLAEAVKIPVDRAVVSDGGSVSVEEALDSADKNEGWAIVEDIHLASPPLLARLMSHLHRIHKSRVNFTEEQGQESKFCVFLTSGTNSALPTSLTQRLLKIAWNSILSYPDLTAKTNSDRDDAAEGEKKLPELFNPLSPRSYLKTAIVSALRLIPEQILDQLQDSNCQQLFRALVFAVAVLHGLLTARQLLGSVGLARWHPFGPAQIEAATQAVLSPMLLTKDQTEPPLDDLVFTISELVYGAMVAEDTDRNYIHSLCEHVLGSVYREPQSEILLGGTLIPVPPASADPRDYAEWFEQNAEDKMALKTLQLSTAVERCTNEASATNFIARMDRMYETQNMEAGDVAMPPPSAAVSLMANPGGSLGPATLVPSVSMEKLRSALDICLEQLPLLLDLGEEAAQLLARTDYDFPYHCPSIISMSSAESSLMPESIGYVLLQECLWMNTSLCHIRQEIADLQIKLVGGATALPSHVLPTALSLQEECVPTSWIHPNCQPCTHSLVTWLTDLNRRHAQLNRWVRRSMVPTFNLSGRKDENQQPRTIARGQLTSVWLGGLVNPGALLTALRQERAILARVDLDEVEFHATVVANVTEVEFDMDEGGIFVADLLLENAAWDFEENGLIEAKGAGITNLKCVYLRPVVRARKPATTIVDVTELEEDQEQEQDMSDRKTTSTKNATVGEDAITPAPQAATDEEKKETAATGNDEEGVAKPEGQENVAGDNKAQDENKTQEEGSKDATAAEDAQRPKSRTSQRSKGSKAGAGAASVKGADVSREDDGGERAEDGDCGSLPPGMVELPVYMNKSRQMQVWTLPVRSVKSDVNWTLCRAAFVLDEGRPEGGCKKSRAYLMLQRLQPMMRPGQGEEEGEEEEEDGMDVEPEEEEEEGTNIEADSGAESTRSQLSYKPMSPKAPPLPEGLGLQRENPIAEGEGEEGQEEGGAEPRPVSRMSAQSRGREEGEKKKEEEDKEKAGEEQAQDQVDGQKSDAEPKTPGRGDEPPAERLDRQGEDDRGDQTEVPPTPANTAAVPEQGEEAAMSGAGQSQPASEAPAAGDDGSKADDGQQSQTAQETIPHPGSRRPSRGSRPDLDKTVSDTDGERGAAGGSRTDAAGGSRVKSGGKKSSGTGGRGQEDEAAQKPATPGQAATSKPASREKLAEKPPSREQPGSKPPSRGQKPASTVSADGKPASKPPTREKQPPSTDKPASKPPSREQPGPKPPSRGDKPASKPASREKPASRASQKKPTSEASAPLPQTSEAGSKGQEEPQAPVAAQEDSGGRGADTEPQQETEGYRTETEPAPAPVERSDDPGHMTLDMKTADNQE